MGYPCISLRPDKWPAPDRNFWTDACTEGNWLEGRGRASTWTTKTRNQVAKDYGRFLFLLQAEDRLIAVRSPAERLTHDNLASYLRQLQGTGMASTSLLSRIRNLRQAVLAMVPDANLRLISSVCSKLKARAVPVRIKQIKVVSTAALIDAATREYDAQISGKAVLAGRVCDRARDALMMMFMALLPLRLDSFGGLCIGRHVVRQGESYVLRLERSEVKEGEPYDCVLPAQLTKYVDHYIRQIRPHLLHGQETDRLWISMRGAGMSASAIYYQIIKITRRIIGHPINPHAFRDCLMTTIATEAPESVRAGARILGHKDLKTGERHYNFASIISVQRAYFAIQRKHRTCTARSGGS
jgi:integrase